MPTAAIMTSAMIASSVVPKANAAGSSVSIGWGTNTAGPTFMYVESD